MPIFSDLIQSAANIFGPISSAAKIFGPVPKYWGADPRRRQQHLAEFQKSNGYARLATTISTTILLRPWHFNGNNPNYRVYTIVCIFRTVRLDFSDALCCIVLHFQFQRRLIRCFPLGRYPTC